MEHFGPGFIVIAVLIAVAVAAIAFQPANPLERWLKLAEAYGTQDRPSQVQFDNQRLFFGGERGGLKELHPGITFGGTIDDHGLWLICRGMVDPQVPAAVKIPGTHIRFAGQRGKQHRFDIFVEPPVRFAVEGDFGAELSQKTQPAAQ